MASAGRRKANHTEYSATQEKERPTATIGMESYSISDLEVVLGREAGNSSTDTQFEEHISQGKLTYGEFISTLQALGVDHHSVRTTTFGTPIGKGNFFSVYRHEVSALDYQSMWLSISRVGHELFQRKLAKPNTFVAIKRMKVKDETGQIDISDQQQLEAISREITALLHPTLRDHDSIVKLQAIIWENGFGTGYTNGPPLWPSLVMEYCDTTLEDYLLRNTLTPLQGTTIGHKVGDGLDALHSANIFHGDVKAENVLLKIGQNGALEPKLADFGCSITFLSQEGKTRYYAVAGTRMWCAPECPGRFTKIEQIEATDWYSFGLLLLRLGTGGKNPFEELGVIEEDWTSDEKTRAVQFIKETDVFYALICGTEGIENLPPFRRFIAGLLLADPAARMEAIDQFDPESDIGPSIEYVRSLNLEQTTAVPDIDMAVNYIERVHEQMLQVPELENTKASSAIEQEQDIRDPLSFVSGFVGKSFVPNCASLSETKRRAALNPATTARIVTELSTALEAEGIFPPRSRCPECCRLTKLDKDPQSLTADSLLQELQQHVQNPLMGHTCQKLIGAISTPNDIKISVAIFGAIRSPMQDRKWKAIWQLFLSTATGFGTQKDPRRALQILESACTSGFTAAANYCLYAAYTGQQLNASLPLRTWLATMVLFSAGIPSDAFSALKQLDPSLSELVAMARSKVYNGSTASFENVKFNSLRPQDNPGCETMPGFKYEGQYLIQDELFENTLLHLAAGSHSMDCSMISYCIDVLDIEIDVRHDSGATPLLLACRAGREEKILALLSLGASVNLTYPDGETPLHWLGLLPDPSRVLAEFLKRNADINAQIQKAKLLPNFIAGCGKFFLAAGPLVWAMAMDNEAYVEALLKNGVNLHSTGPTGISAIGVACWPRFSKFLPRLAQEKTFRVSLDHAYTIIASWSRWNEIGLILNWADPKEQEETLDLVLSFAGPFDSVKEVYDFYHRLVSEAVSDSRTEILEIVLNGLTRSMGAIRNPSPEHGDYTKSPFSHPLWVDHYFLHEAARRGDSGVLAAVLKMNVDAAALDSFGWTALHTLSAYSNNPDCVDILASHGSLEVLGNRIPGWGLTAFMNAIASCNFKVADRLLFYTQPAEREEILSSHPARGLITQGVSVIGNFVVWAPYFGKEPLEYFFNHPDIRDDPSSVFIADESNQTTIIMAAAGSFIDAMYDKWYFATWRRKRAYQFLLSKFPESHHINATDNWGSTALHLAAWTGNFDIAVMLMDHGADLNAIDKTGRSVLDVLFLPDPPIFQHDRDAKKLMIGNFEQGRNDIYTTLKSRGGTHKMRNVIHEGVAEDLPRPRS